MTHANILDTVAAELKDKNLGAGVNVLVPRTPSATADLVVAGKPALWREPTNGSTAVDSIALRPEVASVQVNNKRRRVNVRLEPWWLESLGAALEGGQAEALRVADLAVGRTIAVDFCDPNATKAFHVGHLRNLALGKAIASLAGAAGAEATTLSHIGDMGRSMGKALAGYMTYRDGETPDTAGLKGDHFVGECYSRYSGVENDDLADELLSRWVTGDTSIEDLWRRVRKWVVDGHEKTLRRLGIRFDRLFFESDYIAAIDGFVERAFAAGVAEHAADGSIGYATGQEEYPYVLFQRPNGQWTQYLRYLALWSATSHLLENADSIQVIGNEWLVMEAYSETILGHLDPEVTAHQTDFVVHGMVVADGEKVSSSKGSPWLVDDLLDELGHDPLLKRLAARDPRTAASDPAAIVALAFFLSQPLSKPIPVSRERLLDRSANPGWALAEGWAEAWDPRHDGPPDPDVDDADYRFLLVQAQLHRRFVADALETLDVQPLLRFHAHLCKWFLGEPRAPRTSRAMRTVLRCGLSTLGLAYQCEETSDSG